jgi:hypothetical protein
MEASVVARDHLNDPNYDVEDSLHRSSKERNRNNSPVPPTHPSASIRRRANAGPPLPLSPSLSTTTTAGEPEPVPTGTFPLISAIHNLHQFPPQQPYVHSNNNIHSPYGHHPTPGSSQGVPRINIQKSAKSLDTDEYDLESIAQSSSSRRLSRDSYGYEKKGVVHDSDDMEMETRSDIDFEEYVAAILCFWLLLRFAYPGWSYRL